MLIPAIFLGGVLPPTMPADLAVRARLAPVFDTYIDPSVPDENFGREPALILGNNRSILIDFPEISWHRYSGRRIKSAKMVLTLSRGPSNIPLKISSVKKRWLEGEGRALRFDRPDPANIPWGGASWTFAQLGRGGIKWTAGGAQAATDIGPVDGLTADVQGRELTVSGLGPAIQARIDRPWSSYGFRIDSTADAAFFSGEWTEERPRLEIEWEDSLVAGPDLALMTISESQTPGQFRAIFKNTGTQSIANAELSFKAMNGDTQSVAVEGPFEPGMTKSVSFQSLTSGKDPDARKNVLQTTLIAVGDNNLGNNSLEFFQSGHSIAFEANDEVLDALKAISPAGEPLLLYQMVLAKLNNQVMPFSRYLKSPEGIKVRFNLALDPLVANHRVNLNNLAEVNVESIIQAAVRALVPITNSWQHPPNTDAPWPTDSGEAYSWLPDTRDDGLRLPGLELPTFGFESTTNPIPLWENGLISRIEADYIQNNLGKPFSLDSIKPGILIRTLGANEESLTNTEVSLYRPGSNTPIAKGNSANGGLVYITGDEITGGKLYEPTGSPWLLARATRNGASATTWLPVWQVLDWSVRGNQSTPNVELRFNLPSQALDDSHNLALERIVSDSDGRFPAQLAVLVDGKTDGEIELKPKSWIEIDIGRDRLIGQIDLGVVGRNFPNLEIFAYGTSQNSNASIRWVGLSQLGQLASIYGQTDGEVTTVPIIHTAMRMRYIRLINRGDSSARLAEIRVTAVKS